MTVTKDQIKEIEDALVVYILSKSIAGGDGSQVLMQLVLDHPCNHLLQDDVLQLLVLDLVIHYPKISTVYTYFLLLENSESLIDKITISVYQLGQLGFNIDSSVGVHRPCFAASELFFEPFSKFGDGVFHQIPSGLFHFRIVLLWIKEASFSYLCCGAFCSKIDNVPDGFQDRQTENKRQMRETVCTFLQTQGGIAYINRFFVLLPRQWEEKFYIREGEGERGKGKGHKY